MILYDMSVSLDWYEVAAKQHHAVSAAQLYDAGVSRHERRRLLQQGVIQSAGHRVYTTIGAERSWDTQLWCGVLAGGPGAVGYRRSAAAWWGMDGVETGIIEVAIPPGRQSRCAHVHRVTPLPPTDVTSHLGLPITTVSRTLADLGAVVGPDILERSFEWA
jgi:hypothetical protein